MEYDITLTDLKNRILEIIVNNNKTFVERIGSVEIRLFNINWNSNEEYEKWFDLR
jgi:hypothetical protein